jgi:DNA-directed RNA polymerase specialized sigma24 family protein
MTDLGLIYEKYAPDVFRFALYLTGNRADAEDIIAPALKKCYAAA